MAETTEIGRAWANTYIAQEYERRGRVGPDGYAFLAFARYLSAHPPEQVKPREPSRRQAACATGLRPEELLGDVSLARVEKQPKPSAPLYTDKIAAMMVVRERLGLEPSFALAHSMVLAYEQTLQAPK